MSIYEEFLKKGHKVDPVKDFRELVYRSAIRYGKLPAFRLNNRIISYSEFENEYKAVTTAFIEKGFSEKRIAVVGINSYAWILGYLAAATVGVVVPIDKELSVEDVENFIKEAECSAVVADEKILKKIIWAKIRLNYLLCIIYIA